MSPREEKRWREKIRENLQTDEAMIEFLDKTFGRENYTYDTEADIWVVVDPDYAGDGRGLILFKRGGIWQKMVLAQSVLQ
jgi:hypothetical protein